MIYDAIDLSFYADPCKAKPKAAIKIIFAKFLNSSRDNFPSALVSRSAIASSTSLSVTSNDFPFSVGSIATSSLRTVVTSDFSRYPLASLSYESNCFLHSPLKSSD